MLIVPAEVPETSDRPAAHRRRGRTQLRNFRRTTFALRLPRLLTLRRRQLRATSDLGDLLASAMNKLPMPPSVSCGGGKRTARGDSRRSAGPHTSPHCRGLRLLAGDPHRRHLMTTVSIPSTNSLAGPLPFLRASGDSCLKSLFTRSGNGTAGYCPTKLSPSQVAGDLPVRALRRFSLPTDGLSDKPYAGRFEAKEHFASCSRQVGCFSASYWSYCRICNRSPGARSWQVSQ